MDSRGTHVLERFMLWIDAVGGYWVCMGDEVTLVSSADETARDVFRTLRDADLLRPDHLPPPRHQFLATGDPDEFAVLGRRFLGPEVGTVAALHLEHAMDGVR